MNSQPDPAFYLQLSETFIKTARVEGGVEAPRLVELREISSAELGSQPNPILQIAGEGHETPVPVAATLSLGETIFYSHSFAQIGFSTLSEFIGQQSPNQLHLYELGVFQKENGLPAPTASPAPLELVFCGFNSKTIPELSDAFPNIDARPTSITLSVLDQFRFLKSQCQEDGQVLLVEISMDRTHLFLIGKEGLVGIRTIDLGRHSLYEAMAEVLHLHYTGSAIKLFTRSGFDSSELAPKLGKLFGPPIQAAMDEAGWDPNFVHVTGLLKSQSWFQAAILQALNLQAFVLDRTLLPFVIDESIETLDSMDVELMAKIYTSLTLTNDFSWYNDYLGCLGKSRSIQRRKAFGSNPPFPTAHPDRASVVGNLPEEVPLQQNEENLERPVQVSPVTPNTPRIQPDHEPSEVIHSSEKPQARNKIEAIPAHMLSEIEDYDGEFEEVDDFGGGTTRFLLKIGLFLFSLAIIGVLVTIVFFPRASEQYLGIRPPHINYDDAQPVQKEAPMPGVSTEWASSVEVSDAEVESGLKNLRSEREVSAFGGLYMLTNPSGATVIVDEMEPLFSPIKLPNIAPGTYDIIISKDGYETRTLTVTIRPKQVLKTETINLKPLP